MNQQEGQYFLREYPQGDLTSPWLGYNSLQYGRAGVERVYNEELSGQSGLLGITSYWDQILGKTHRGADLKLTIDMAVQRAAAEALGDRKGAVVALDPRTGAVLAMVSYPRYDPNELDADWKDLNSDPDKPLLNRAIQGLYPPGSVFKIIVAAAALQTGTRHPRHHVRRHRHRHGGRLRGAQLRRQRLRRARLHRGLRRAASTPPSPRWACSWAPTRWPGTPATSASASRRPGRWVGPTSVFPDPAGMDKAHVAQASFGQGEVLATPAADGPGRLRRWPTAARS